VKRFRIQTLVLCPTRELADQVAVEIRKLARTIHNIKVLTLCGGTPLGPQIGSLEHGAHIIVGTPGRIDDHLQKGTLKLDNLHTLVLDEADRMLDMGFQETIDTIIDAAPKKRQTLLFSATFPSEIASIARRIMVNPVSVEAASSHDNDSIEQHFYEVGGNSERTDAIHRLLMEFRPQSSVVFCNTKLETQQLADKLHYIGFDVLSIHGDLDQRERDQALLRFANGSVSVLVATDVAARGLDIESLDAVFNYHIANDLEVHTHRIGRTGRAGEKGIACSLFSEKEHFKLERLQAEMKQNIRDEALPSRNLTDKPPFQAKMVTLQIDGGKKQKIRPGDILGALTGENGIAGDQVGKIHRFDNHSYVAINKDSRQAAVNKLNAGKLKGRNFRVRVIDSY